MYTFRVYSVNGNEIDIKGNYYVTDKGFLYIYIHKGQDIIFTGCMQNIAGIEMLSEEEEL